MKSIFGERVFDFPKPSDLLKFLFSVSTYGDSIILDSFAGSGTTAHAVLNLNRQDGGNRKFILCEMCDYADTVTAERVRRVMSGYGEGKNAVEGTGGSFDFYELGETIFDPVSGNLNDNADTEQIRRYVWFSETNSAYVAPSKDAHPFLLGSYQHNNYYFFYIKGEETCLDWDFLNTFTERDRAEMYIIYADRCVLTPEEMLKHNIVFKKIPRDIKRV
jgi:adenine-specific DNA-methyltransferase